MRAVSAQWAKRNEVDMKPSDRCVIQAMKGSARKKIT